MDYELKDVLIKLDDVQLKFGDKTVLAGIDAEVRDIVRPGVTQGQVVALLGPSGIGKTVLCRTLTGLQQPTAGSITVGHERSPIQAGTVGFVAQNYPLLRHRTVLGNLLVAARRVYDGKLSHEKAWEYLRNFELTDKASFYPAELSGGQRQRVAIAQQLLCSEHYLVLDEPTTGLDPIMKDKVVELIRQVSCLHEENTIFIISHDIPAVMSVADQIWMLGRVRNEKGESMGAKIMYKHDLAALGYAWNPAARTRAPFFTLQDTIRKQFDTL